ncbi:arsenate reductase [Polaribacter sp. Hel1_33_78]|jgi:arsenate reductase|uniref:arsenate reductase family protein n=1 Tax=Polaribacter sp. Hel1_33_78 TaxID=1336804 RepID=UPI00087D35AA|nr:ArsC/Spx/MgsR family protein [Polaribacter sp. Hel1_33_78]MBT3741455.1 arsenate reductase [Polaribacter sp.]MBT4413708.1 arsenate reductase [Polaribacter sp.]MDG2437118.1 ArsC/Spx/MgsR family protein [Polaribacter sp.]SDU25604.1 arsenate reductase [Polaribacter sp. Hel1_33_78]
MKKVYFLQTCDTCRRILKEVNTDGFERQEIKANNVSVSQLDEMHQLSGSYEALFNKRAKLYKAMDLKNQILSETDYKQYILDEYTFLKRPVFILNNEIFIGNSKKVVQDLKEKIG